MDNNIYTPQEAKAKEKNSMYVTIGTWALVIVAVAIMFTAIMMVKSQLSENQQVIYENSKAIQDLQECVDNDIKPCTTESKETN